ncbi:MAG: AAA family ATPase [Acidobacteria bacterium]|nr:AAA family ATPase [Acidobacteriota bacterium]
MARFGDIQATGRERLDLPGLLWLQDALGGGLVRGGNYLIAGDPGGAKTTLAAQISVAVAKCGVGVVYLTNEQGIADIAGVMERVSPNLTPEELANVKKHLFCDDIVPEVKDLPDFIVCRMLADGQEYHGCRMLVYDSIQGHGLAPTAVKQYHFLYKFLELARKTGLCTLLIGHVTKRGLVAGPKDLEHNIDVMIYLRRAFRLRLFFVPKNRFGRAIPDPVVLTMDENGRLLKAPHTTAQSSVVWGWSGDSENLTEAQAVVSMPPYGSNPELNAPNLPRERIKQLLCTIRQLKDVDVTNLSYTVNCFLPGHKRYCVELDLPLAVSLLSSYLQQGVEPNTLFIGELDLNSRIRRPSPSYLAGLAHVLVHNHTGIVRRVYLSADCEQEFQGYLAEEEKNAQAEGLEVDYPIQIIGVLNLAKLLNLLWPDLGITNSAS